MIARQNSLFNEEPEPEKASLRLMPDVGRALVVVRGQPNALPPLPNSAKTSESYPYSVSFMYKLAMNADIGA